MATLSFTAVWTADVEQQVVLRHSCAVQVLRSIQDNITEEDLIEYVARPQSGG